MKTRRVELAARSGAEHPTAGALVHRRPGAGRTRPGPLGETPGTCRPRPSQSLIARAVRQARRRGSRRINARPGRRGSDLREARRHLRPQVRSGSLSSSSSSDRPSAALADDVGARCFAFQGAGAGGPIVLVQAWSVTSSRHGDARSTRPSSARSSAWPVSAGHCSAASESPSQVASIWRPLEHPPGTKGRGQPPEAPMDTANAVPGVSPEPLVMMGSGVRVPPSASEVPAVGSRAWGVFGAFSDCPSPVG
jgi:hypothetical protein